MSCPVSNVIAHIQAQLGDKDGIRYTSENVLAWLNLAVLEVAGHRPDFFAQPKTVTLQPGCVQNLCSQCTKVTAILSTIGNECVEPVKDEQEKTNICDFLGDDPCQLVQSDSDDTPEYAIENYTLDGEQPCFIRIKGDGVPDDGKVYQARVMCYEKPPLVCADDDLPECLCGPYLACLTWNVMARAATLNDASTTSLQRSQIYLNNFYTCMNGLRDIAYAFEADNFYLRGPDTE